MTTADDRPSDSTPPRPGGRALRFAVTGALLAGATGCPQSPGPTANPGPVPTPAPSVMRTNPGPDDLQQASPAPSPTPEAAPPPEKTAEMRTNVGPGPGEPMKKQ